MKVKETMEKYERYTYSDYEKWDDGNRYELIDGEMFMMTAPLVEHQRVSSKLHGQLWNFLREKQCEVFSAPFDVCLNAEGDEDDTVVQPDLLVVCDKSKLDKKRCNGAPDMVVEILSPSTSSRDMVLKFNKYREAGVREYWIVDPAFKIINVNTLKGGEYVASVYGDTGGIPVGVLESCVINIGEVFSEEF